MSECMLDLEFDDHLHTYLSSNVYQLLCEIGVNKYSVEVQYCHCSLSDGLLQWNTFSSDFQKTSLKTSDDYSKWIRQLAPLFKQIRQIFSCISRDEFDVRHSRYTLWTGQKSSIFRCFNILQKGGPTASIRALLLLTAVLERALGDLVLLKASQCPSLLRDLLAMPELQDLLSPIAVNFFLLLVGPPISLNLRNVVWHGFTRPGELCDQYPYVVLSTILSVGCMLENVGIVDIPHRHFMTLSVPSIFPQLNHAELDEIQKLFSQSTFLVPSMRPFWDLALCLFRKGHFGECLVVLLPQLELALRRVFVSANHCSQRLLTAENSTLFTTMDEILNQFMADGSENRLRHVLGDSYLTLLLDCLVYPLGPRIRDRVSHGEVDLLNQCSETPSYVICVCAAIAEQFLPPCTNVLKSTFIQLLKQTAGKYTSLFHTVSFAKQRICSAATSLSSLKKNMKRPDCADLDMTLSSNDQHTIDLSAANKSAQAFVELFPKDSQLSLLVSLLLQCDDDIHLTLIAKLENFHPNTVYRYGCMDSSREEELLKSIIRISNLVSSASFQILEVANYRFDQWHRKEMRSRQRANYTRLLNSTFVISAALTITVVIMATTVCNVDNMKSKISMQMELIKLFKTFQKYAENLSRYTKIDYNRWDEAAVTSRELFSKVHHFMDSLSQSSF